MRVAALAARQHGVVSIGQLLALGLDDGAVARRVRRGMLHRRYRGIYAVGPPTLSEDGERMAAVLAAGPGSAMSHIALAELAAFRGRFVEPAVRDAMARANGRHKLGVLERAIQLHRSGCPGTKSAGEDAFLALFPHDEPLVNLYVEGRQVDFHWPQHRLVIEIDGAGHERDPTRLDDQHRDAMQRAAGWTVLRFPRAVVFERPEHVRDLTTRAFRTSSHPRPRLEGDGTQTVRVERAARRGAGPRRARAA